jgi:hypothetical protein
VLLNSKKDCVIDIFVGIFAASFNFVIGIIATVCQNEPKAKEIKCFFIFIFFQLLTSNLAGFEKARVLTK